MAKKIVNPLGFSYEVRKDLLIELLSLFVD